MSEEHVQYEVDGSPRLDHLGTAAPIPRLPSTSFKGSQQGSYMATYHFDTQDALDYGVESAVILYNLCFWIKHNEANGQSLHNGMYWTYNSTKAFKSLFPFWSDQKIGRLLRKLEADGAIVSANFNKAGFDKTKWYSVLKSACLNSKTPLIKIDEPIPDINTDIKQHISNVGSNEPPESSKNSTPKPLKKRVYVPPPLDVAIAWAEKEGHPVSLVKEAWNYYERLGWKDSRGTRVKAWKQKFLAVWLTPEKVAKAKPEPQKKRVLSV